MKIPRKLCTLVLAVAGFAFAHTTSAAACNTDSLIGSANPGNSGQATEEALLEGFAGVALAFDYRLENNQAGFNITVCANDANRFYIYVAPDTPGYFVLKFGDGGTDAVNDTFFFKNAFELSELVFTSAQVECLVGGPGCPTNTNTGRLSHYSLYDGGTPFLIPEPGTLALLGIGALGLGLARRPRNG